ncbi:MAG: SDR family oxidoreductase [Rhizomicrobium sp.]
MTVRADREESQHKRSLEGRVAIVTGASRGLGRGIALRFAEEGAILSLCARSEPELAAVAEEARARGARVHHRVCDVTSKAAVEALVASTAEAEGRIDILVNNAAYMAVPVPLDTYDEQLWEDVLSGGLTSAFLMMKAVYPHMRRHGGRIVNMTSLGGIRGVKGAGAYGAAKTGLIGLSRAAANDWGRDGIRVNCVAPMAMSDAWASFMKTLPPGTDPWAAIGVRSNTLGYVGDPERDIAPAVVFLCSDDARYITGAVLPVDGGLLDVE